MAKTLSAPEADTAKADSAKPGHNSGGLSDADKRALLLTHIAAIREQKKRLDEIKAEVAEEAKELGDRFRMAKVELGKTYSRKFIEQEILAPLDRMREGGNREFDEERAFARETFGFPNGPQGELFARMPDTEQDRARWVEDGRQAGLQGLEGTPPEGCPTIFHGDWQHAWSDGQAELGRAWAIRDRITAAADPEAGDDEDEEADEFDADAEARKLRKSGFLDTASDDEASVPEAAE